MVFSKTLIVAALCFVAPQASGFKIRHANKVHVPAAEDPALLEAQAQANKTWEQTNDAMAAMFKLACQWKHGRDIDRAITEKVTKKEIKPEEMMDAKKKAYEASAAEMKSRCAETTLTSNEMCAKNCLDRSKSNAIKVKCTEDCKSTAQTWKKECETESQKLKVVGQRKLEIADEVQACYNQHCKSFPSAWDLESDADIAAEVTKQCQESCSESDKDDCQSECEGSCDPGAMNACVAAPKAKEDPTTAFCGSLWDLVHSYSLYDPSSNDMLRAGK
eukprot:TRINITY_DN1397_c0_g2_i3.p1 TRINITY_DN1397_c0_g2~~TRINITY_DN1397_c0_g2_i3.p1  ORF type:complete len:275 (+),score=88.77 TRINITY_DN1397_c0_g2_i3:78-902(+)